MSTFEIQIGVQSNRAASLPAEENAAWLAGFLHSPKAAASGQQLLVEHADEQGHIIVLRAKDPPVPKKTACKLVSI